MDLGKANRDEILMVSNRYNCNMWTDKPLTKEVPLLVCPKLGS